MEKNEERQFTIITDDGKEILCEVLFTYYSEEFKHKYVVFAEEGTNNVSAARINSEEAGKGTLDQIETDEEWAMLEEVLEDYSRNMEEDGCGCDHCDGSCSEEGCEHDCDCDDEECECHHHHE